MLRRESSTLINTEHKREHKTEKGEAYGRGRAERAERAAGGTARGRRAEERGSESEYQPGLLCVTISVAIAGG